MSWGAEGLTREAGRAVSPSGSVQRPCGLCGRNSAIGRVPSRLKDSRRFGDLETAKQPHPPYRLLPSLFPPKQGALPLLLSKASRRLLPSTVPAALAPQKSTCSLRPPLAVPPVPSALPPRRTPPLSGAAVAPAGACGKQRGDKSGNSRPWRECLNTGTIWGLSFIFSLKSVHPPAL